MREDILDAFDPFAAEARRRAAQEQLQSPELTRALDESLTALAAVDPAGASMLREVRDEIVASASGQRLARARDREAARRAASEFATHCRATASADARRAMDLLIEAIT